MTSLFKPKRIHRRTCRQAISLLLAAVMLSGVMFGLPQEVKAETSTEQALSEARQAQAALEAQMAEVGAERRQLESELGELSGQLSWLNQRSEEQKQLYRDKTAQLEAAIAQMEQAYRAYADAQEELISKQEQYVDRMRTMFDHRNRSLFELFLQSGSLRGFFTTLQFMTIVADTDQQMIEDLEAAQDNAQLKKIVAEETTAEMETVVTQLQVDIERLKSDAAATELDMNQLSRQLSAHEQAEEELANESASVGAMVVQLQAQLEAERAAEATRAAEEARRKAAEESRRKAEEEAARKAAEEEARRAAAEESRRKAEEAAAQATTKEPSDSVQEPSAQAPSSSGWTWPAPGNNRITSGYGYRIHPVYGYRRMHTGIDISGSFGDPIVAARPGTVILVNNPVEGRNWGGSGYGNYIVIDHGDGLATLYAHLKSTNVTTMQQVRAGDRIGGCGSTGTSTGAHLHFEVWINGNHTNPLSYLR